MNNRIKEIAKNPLKIFMTLGHHEFLNWMSDETYLKIAFYICMRGKLDLENPQTYNEKLQWLKLYDRKPEYINMVDKYEAKRIAEKIIGKQYIIPTIGVWNSFDEIDFNSLPEQFVLKCTHDSGSVFICKDKSKFDKKSARKRINRCLKHNFFWANREWPYKYVKPRIIAEQYMEDGNTQELHDYKYFTFNGEAKAMYIATERFGKKEAKFDFFDMNYHHLPFANGRHPNADELPEKPKNFELMAQLAERLSQGVPELRIDFYEVNGRVYFGEYTFFYGGGMEPFKPQCWDEKFGNWIKLPIKD